MHMSKNRECHPIGYHGLRKGVLSMEEMEEEGMEEHHQTSIGG
jgi:hypothetical protein